MRYGSGSGRGERGDGFTHEGREVLVSVAPGTQQDDREVEAGRVLLVWDALVGGKKQGVGLLLREFEGFAIAPVLVGLPPGRGSSDRLVRGAQAPQYPLAPLAFCPSMNRYS